MVGHQRGGLALERVEHVRRPAPACRRWRRAPPAPARRAPASRSARPAPRRARTRARWPPASGCAPRRRCRSARTRRGAARARTWARARRAPAGPSRSTTLTCSARSSASTAPVGVTATWSPRRALRLPGGAEHQPLLRRANGRPRPPARARRPAAFRLRRRARAEDRLTRCRVACAQPAVIASAGVALAIAAPAAAAGGPGLEAGVGRADITPPTGYIMLGWARGDARALGQHTRLYAKAIVLRRGASRLVLVSEDLNMVPGGMVQQAARRAGLRRARGDRPGHAHARRAHRLLELPLQGPRLRDAAGSEVGGQPARPAPLHLHGPAPGARHPPRRCQPPSGAGRRGAPPAFCA